MDIRKLAFKLNTLRLEGILQLRPSGRRFYPNIIVVEDTGIKVLATLEVVSDEC